jgi:hypothetical protein
MTALLSLTADTNFWKKSTKLSSSLKKGMPASSSAVKESPAP